MFVIWILFTCFIYFYYFYFFCLQLTFTTISSAKYYHSASDAKSKWKWLLHQRFFLLFLLFNTLSVVWRWALQFRIIDGWWIKLKENTDECYCFESAQRKSDLHKSFVLLFSNVMFLIYLVLLVPILFPWFWIRIVVPCHIRTFKS